MAEESGLGLGIYEKEGFLRVAEGVVHELHVAHFERGEVGRPVAHEVDVMLQRGRVLHHWFLLDPGNRVVDLGQHAILLRFLDLLA